MSCAASLAGLILIAVGATGGEAVPETAAEHPLMPLLRYASARYQQLDREILDYTCTLVKHERVRGRLLEPEYMQVKIRHEQVRDGRVVAPLSVYLHFTAPDVVKGREVIYVAGRYDGQIVVRNGGPRFAYITTAIDPAGDLAMQRNRYPVTEIGLRNLIMRLIEVGNEDVQYGQCEVRYYSDAKVNGRKCTVMEVTHPERRDYFTYHVARIFVDDEFQLPIRYAAYEWPDEEGGEPPLIEEYTYLDLKLNVGLSDWDFDYRNPEYQFRKSFTP
jgi:hypothetical protein